MRIGQNTSLVFSNQLNQTSKAVARSLERLASGKRVVNPHDDVASHSSIVGFDSQVRGLTQAAVNINAGRGLLQTLSGGLSSQIDIVQQMRDLALKASNSFLTASERQSLQENLASLTEEFNQLVNSTEFNGFQLLNGSMSNLSLQVGASASDLIDFDLDSFKSSDVFKKLESTGSYTESGSFSFSSNPRQLETADFDGDGYLDIINPSGAASAGIDIAFGDGNGGVREVKTITDAGSNLQDVSIADFNSDGILDFVIADRNDDSASVYIGNGDGTFQARVTYGEDDRVYKVGTGDFDGDGIQDIVSAVLVGTTSHISVRLGLGDGTFQVAQTIVGRGTTATELDLAVGDLDNDGRDDIVLASAIGVGSAAFDIFSMDGDGVLNVMATFNGNSATSINLGDVNGDGILDIVAADRDGVATENLASYIGDGNGSFAAALNTEINNGVSQHVILTDFNGDGILDALVGGSFGAELRLGDGTGLFGANIISISGDIEGVVAGDFNGDGVVDFALGNNTTDVGTVYTSNTKTVSALQDFSVMTTEKAQALVDILDNSLDRLLAGQSEVGAYLSRLDYAGDAALLLSDSIADAKSRMEDVDLTYELTELVKNQILEQAQIAVMTQANSNMQSVLQLLQNL